MHTALFLHWPLPPTSSEACKLLSCFALEGLLSDRLLLDLKVRGPSSPACKLTFQKISQSYQLLHDEKTASETSILCLNLHEKAFKCLLVGMPDTVNDGNLPATFAGLAPATRCSLSLEGARLLGASKAQPAVLVVRRLFTVAERTRPDTSAL